ncbi:EthD family reductase [Pseudomonas typographi]|uniref:EthD family reductase n=1 Tax=Pseudomonas typographi TaxID=2715964 RepID=A0ABR7ZA88_9PSED|nr:EthD family reductase [Pseudomonas typographi]MBD1551619.1 EthD family reductase [Pseudomonas typographi]MBD1587127.1 EthD family reductase [Pseudomonas typographi]MBD1602173.1 EthD family reductase [Pseudomonas typographi]
MPQHSETVTIYVTYEGDATTPFDRDYYVNHHLPLVMQAWQPHGLLSASALFPAQPQAGTIALCECRFRDEAALAAAFAAPQTPGVIADVANFTGVTPVQVRAVPLA